MNKIFIANWKMFLSLNEEINWIKQNIKELEIFSKKHQIILSPSYLSLYPIYEIIKNTQIYLAAQNCASVINGAFTGEVSAKSIKEAGCTYCIIGHSERRKYFNETNESISLKIQLLSDHDIIPIVCIGETEKQHKNNETFETLDEQLKVIENINYEKIIIAYEPIWSIGTDITPSNSHISEIYKFILEKTNNKFPILYGGSVNEKTIYKLKEIADLSGFLIGKASIDLQNFKKIISLYN